MGDAFESKTVNFGCATLNRITFMPLLLLLPLELALVLLVARLEATLFAVAVVA